MSEDPNAVVTDPFWDDVFAEKNFTPIPMGGYTNSMFITMLVIGGSLVLMLIPLIVFLPCTILVLAWFVLLYLSSLLVTGGPEFLGRLIVSRIVAFGEWLGVSGFVYILRAIEYGLVVGIAELSGGETATAKIDETTTAALG